MSKYRYRTGQWCYKCKNEIPEYSIICPDCGGGTNNGTIKRFAVLRYIWVEITPKWWNWYTWQGGYWTFDGEGQKEE